MRQFIVAIAAASLAGCATSQLGMLGMQSAGQLRVEPAEVDGYDYRVTVANVREPGFDGDVREHRERLARAALQAECRNVDVVDEKAITLGAYLGGKPRRHYVMRVKCLRG